MSYALAAQFLTLAEKQKASFPLVLGHHFLGHSLILTGDMAEGRTHLDQAIALYDPAEHRRLATRFGQDRRVPSLCFRSSALWFLGYPEAALADAHHAISYAREIGQAATLMFALCHASLTEVFCGNYVSANALYDELDLVGGRKRRPVLEGARTGRYKVACWPMPAKPRTQFTRSPPGSLHSGQREQRGLCRLYLSYLARAHADLGHFDDAWRCISEAITAVDKTKERWSRPR